jgi:hypothetical protein
VHRFHFILFIIRIDQGEVEVWDSLRKDEDDYRSVRIMLKRYYIDRPLSSFPGVKTRSNNNSSIYFLFRAGFGKGSSRKNPVSGKTSWCSRLTR